MSNTKAVKDHPAIHAYQTEQGKRYAAVATVKGVKRWSRGHRTIKDAEHALDLLRAAMGSGGRFTVSRRLKVTEYIEAIWLPSLDVTASSLANYRSNAKHITKAIGNVGLADLAPAHIDNLLKAMRDRRLAQATQRQIFGVLANSLKDAVRRGLIPDNPCDRVKPPKLKHSPRKIPTKAQLDTLLETAKSHGIYALVYLACATGLRRGELFALQWADLEMGDEAVLTVGKSKTAAGTGRAIALGPDAVDVLRQHRLEQMRRFHKFGSDGCPLVFPSQVGTQMLGGNFGRIWRRLRDEAGLSGLHFHDLRHYNATLRALSGQAPGVASKAMGHSKASLTLDIYTHANAASYQREGAMKVEEMLR